MIQKVPTEDVGFGTFCFILSVYTQNQSEKAPHEPISYDFLATFEEKQRFAPMSVQPRLILQRFAPMSVQPRPILPEYVSETKKEIFVLAVCQIGNLTICAR